MGGVRLTGDLAIDVLTSATLKHLREHWWSDDFTAFLRETLRPRPGNRILGVGCGTGTAEVSIGRLHLSQIRLVGVDLMLERVIVARHMTRSHNQRVSFSAADACHLPFVSGTFDSTYCVAVLQHIRDVPSAVSEFARVTRDGGRILAVEPDNIARYWHSSVPAGAAAYDARTRFFNALEAATGQHPEGAVGPKLPTFFAEHGIEPLSVRLFPVSQARIGAPTAVTWNERTSRIQREIDHAPTEPVKALGREYLAVLKRYAEEATAAADSFVEIQNTMLFATVGQKNES